MSRAHWRFLVPSLAGAAVFLVPIPYQGALTVPMGILNDMLAAWLEPYASAVLLSLLSVSALLSLLLALGPPAWSARSPVLRRLFHVGPLWTTLRLAALLTALSIFTRSGPGWLWGASTGQVIYDLAIAVITLFTVAALLLPLLTDFGLMELVGSLLSPLFRRLFTLPGRSAVDASASWLATAAVGVLITSQQYQRGHYTAREACVIATNFSIVSLPFCLLVASVLNVADRFVAYYAAVTVIGLVLAVLMPRLPPLRGLPDLGIDGTPARREAAGSSAVEALRSGYAAALRRAQAAPGPVAYLSNSAVNLVDMWLSLLPGILTVGLLGVILVEHTPLFRLATLPLVPLLNGLGLPEAASAAPALLVGFVDMFLPVAVAREIDSELTRFVVAGVAVTQLIYLSEVGILILKLPIPLGFRQLLLIFALRTSIALPLFVLAGRLLLG